MTTLSKEKKTASWREWKEKCAIDLCCPETQKTLSEFAAGPIINRFAKYDATDCLPDSNKEIWCWHLFELYMHTGTKQNAKRWKDWLFERAATWKEGDLLTGLESSAQSCFRTATNNHLVLERKIHTTSLDKKTSPMADDSEIFLPLAQEAEISPAKIAASQQGELAESPSDSAVKNELEKIANTLASSILETMKRHVKIALLADHLDISLKHPTVEKIAGKSGSTLYESLHSSNKSKITHKYSALFEPICSNLRENYLLDNSYTLHFTAASTILALKEKIFSWAKSENSLRPLFLLMK